jgi:hypothetical protein
MHWAVIIHLSRILKNELLEYSVKQSKGTKRYLRAKLQHINTINEQHI